MKISSTIIKTNLGKIYIEAINKSIAKLEWTNIKKIPKIFYIILILLGLLDLFIRLKLKSIKSIQIVF